MILYTAPGIPSAPIDLLLLFHMLDSTFFVSSAAYGWAIRCSTSGRSCVSVWSLEFLRISVSSPGIVVIPCIAFPCSMFVQIFSAMCMFLGISCSGGMLNCCPIHSVHRFCRSSGVLSWFRLFC